MLFVVVGVFTKYGTYRRNCWWKHQQWRTNNSEI